MENNAGAGIFIIWLFSIVISIVSGIAAWNWIDPKSFFGALVFILVWSILFKVIHVVISGIVMLLFEK